MTIGERIKNRRLELGLTQNELAKAVGYKSRSSINKIEIGERDITQSTIEAFAKALNVTPAYIMGWDMGQADELVNGDPELTELLETLKNRPEQRMLFSLTKDATKEDVEKAVEVYKAMFGKK